MAMKKRREIWAKGRNWRMITDFYKSGDIEYVYGQFDQPVLHVAGLVGGARNLVSSITGSGRETWYRGLSYTEEGKRLGIIRGNALKAGFELLAEWEE